jgi:hypothetical protein
VICGIITLAAGIVLLTSLKSIGASPLSDDA